MRSSSGHKGIAREFAGKLQLALAAAMTGYLLWFLSQSGGPALSTLTTWHALAVTAAFSGLGLGLIKLDCRKGILAGAVGGAFLLGLYLHSSSDWAQVGNVLLLAVGFSGYLLPRERVLLAAFVSISAMLLAPLLLGPFSGVLYFSLGIFSAAGLKLHNELRNGQLQSALAAARDELLKREKAEAALRCEEERYRLVAHGTNDGWWDWDLDRDEVYFSPRWKSMLGYRESEIGTDPEEWLGRVHPEDLEGLQDRIAFHVRRGSSTFRAEYRVQHKDGSYRWMACRGVAVPSGDGKVVRMAGSQTDITEHKVNEERLHHQAFHDELTGLPNRAVFVEHLDVALRRTRDDPSYHFAVLFLDLDRFKVVNDSLGHLAGDELLKSVTERLQNELYPINVVARLGGDEFAILIDSMENAREALLIANCIRQEFRRPFHLAGRDIFVTPSIGVAWGKPEYHQPEDLLRDADTAMYQAKTSGRNCCEMFQKRMHSRAVDLLHLENDLRRAVENLEFTLHYQPIVSLETYQIVGIEALLRWEHPEQGLLTPGQFLNVAEETGLIIPVYWWVLRESCRFLKEVRSEIPSQSGLAISVNLSGRQFGPDLVQRVMDAVEETGTPAEGLCLEITENVLVNQAEESSRMLEQLQAQGVRIHLDDFGTGYSSLGYLNQFSFDALKIDRSFIQSLAANGENMKIVRAMVDLAHNLSMEVVVEGLETIEQIQHMKALQSDLGQGYYFSHPLPASDIKALLENEPRLAVFDYWRQTKTG